MGSDDIFIALFLDAPLQSWGYQSRFDRRTTLSHPTRSGIIGLVCAAMGVDRADAEWLGQLATLPLSVYAFQLGPRLTDFHTVGGGWDKKRDPQCIVPKADGKAGQTVVSRRDYLQHARFGAIVQTDPALGERMATALKDPVWGIWLGRKSCIPASPVFQGCFPSESEAVAKLEAVAGKKVIRRVVEVANFEDGTDTLMDVPMDFARRRFSPRRVLVE